jgi:hypothetical protein
MYEIESLTTATSAVLSADGLFDVVETQATEARDALTAVVILCVAAMAFAIALKARMAMAAVLVVCLTAGVVLWLVVGGGTEFIAKVTGEQFASGVLSVPVVV